MKPALAFVFIGLLVGELLLPDFERTARVSRENATEGDITPAGGFWYREGNRYMHFNTVSHDGFLRNVNQYFINDKQQLTKTLWAESASYISFLDGDKSGFWRLKNVIVTDLNAQIQRQQYEQMTWNSNLTPELLSAEILVDPDKMSIVQLMQKVNHMKSQGLNTDKFQLGFWTKIFQPIAALSLVFVAISFIFGPLRETNMGMRVVSGLITGIVFKFVQDLLAPASLVFGFSPFIATTIPILICMVVGYSLLKRAN